ncbi:MAG: argininosuccinate lyase [Rhodobacteraceae bacterium]|nr:argininosuccinate lyase [Paracoccaceae bacterium]
MFPDPNYRANVLAPLFETVKTHYADHMDTINRAHLVMLCETGILTAAQGQKIAAALSDIDQDIDLDELTYSGEFEDYFFLIEAELVKRLGDLGGMLHVGRSRNDMDHTMFRMALRGKAEQQFQRALDLAHSLIGKARIERDTLIVAYTHGQPAQPTTFGHYVAAIVEVLLRDAERLDAAMEVVDLCPMGAAAVTTTGFPIDRRRISDLLGFRAPAVNSYGCIASVDYITGLYSAIKLVFLHLGRVFQDMAQWSSFEVGQLHVPDSLVQVSSIMPQKRNPVSIEHMRLLASLVVGHCDTVLNVMHNTPFTDMNDSEAEVQQTGHMALDCGERVLSLLSSFIPSCSINSARISVNADQACITITELADTLVREEGLYFRQAHAVAASTARAVIANGQRLGSGYAAFSSAFTSETGRKTRLSEETYANAVMPDVFVARRDRLGGPSQTALESAFLDYENVLRSLQDRNSERAARREQANISLETAFNMLLKG